MSLEVHGNETNLYQKQTTEVKWSSLAYADGSYTDRGYSVDVLCPCGWEVEVHQNEGDTWMVKAAFHVMLCEQARISDG